jgi:transcriptional regulator with XRE-family HTH domain
MLKNETKLEKSGIDKRISENIKRLRKERGISSAQLGRLCGIPWLSRVESGKKAIGKQGLVKLARCLDVDISEFYRNIPQNQSRRELLLQVFDVLTAEGQALIIEQAKSLAVYEARMKWRE